MSRDAAMPCARRACPPTRPANSSAAASSAAGGGFVERAVTMRFVARARRGPARGRGPARPPSARPATRLRRNGVREACLAATVGRDALQRRPARACTAPRASARRGARRSLRAATPSTTSALRRRQLPRRSDTSHRQAACRRRPSPHGHDGGSIGTGKAAAHGALRRTPVVVGDQVLGVAGRGLHSAGKRAEVRARAELPALPVSAAAPTFEVRGDPLPARRPAPRAFRPTTRCALPGGFGARTETDFRYDLRPASGRPGLARRRRAWVGPGQRPVELADDPQHHLVRAATDRHQAPVAVQARDRVLPGEAHAAPVLQAGRRPRGPAARP